MAFEPGKATVVTDEGLLATYGRAFRKIGKTVVVVPLGDDLHVGHIELIRAAKSLLGSYVVVTYSGPEVPDVFAAEKVDVVFRGELDTSVRVDAGVEPLENPEETSRAVARILAAVNATHATDVVLGEKDFEVLVATQYAVSGLRMEVKLHSVPTVRGRDGLALSLRNRAIPEEEREKALALSAALTAGAHVAEHGEETVVETVRGVLDSAGVAPVYVEVRDLALRAAPATGDARLLAAVEVGGVRLVDNVGLPLGIGFKNIE